MRIALDTSLIVAALSPWHDRHEAACTALDACLTGSDEVFVPVHALIEAYSVLTRLPTRYRLRPQDAQVLLDESLKESTTVVASDDQDVWGWLDRQARRRVTGGAVYDARVLACARRVRAERLLTLNQRAFSRLGAPEIGIEVPTI